MDVVDTINYISEKCSMPNGMPLPVFLCVSKWERKEQKTDHGDLFKEQETPRLTLGVSEPLNVSDSDLNDFCVEN